MSGRQCQMKRKCDNEQEEGGSSTGIVEGQVVRPAAMQSNDGTGVSALGATHLAHTTITESERGRAPRRSKRGKVSHVTITTPTVETDPGGGVKGPAREGYSANSTGSSSVREPTTSSRGQHSGTRDRNSSKRLRGGALQNRVIAAEGNAVANLIAVPNASRRNEVAIGITGSCNPIEDHHRIGEYFPLIHDELGLQCLTRLPRHKIHNMATVCRKWKEFLLSSELYKARRLLGVREDWVFLLGHNEDNRWRAFVPSVERWLVLPPCPSDYTFDSCDKESMVAGLNLLVLGQATEGFIVWKFDTIKSEWSPTPRMHTDRCMFGSASFNKYAYFAGGTNRGTVLKSVERYNSETNSWEMLTAMNLERKACSGFVMDGKFHVIGGHVQNQILSSGEVYDPHTEAWTVIEGMWPQDFVPSTNVSPPLVAVLNDKLYGINIVLNMLMSYNKETNEWNHLGKVPARAENVTGWGLGFKTVGDELFVIGGSRGPGQFVPVIHAYRPREDGSPTWRFVTDLKIPTNGFIYNCAVMSG